MTDDPQDLNVLGLTKEQVERLERPAGKVTLQLGATRAHMHEQTSKTTEEDRTATTEWLKTRPESVQKAADGIDMFRVYRVKEGASHMMTGPGTVGMIEGFTEQGELVFVAHVVCPHPTCETWKVERMKKNAQPIKVHISRGVLEFDPTP